MRLALKIVGVTMFVVSVIMGFLTATGVLIALFGTIGATLGLICYAIARMFDAIDRVERKVDRLAAERSVDIGGQA